MSAEAVSASVPSVSSARSPAWNGIRFSLRHSLGPSSVSSRWCIHPSPSSGQALTSSIHRWSSATPAPSSVWVSTQPCIRKSSACSAGSVRAAAVSMVSSRPGRPRDSARGGVLASDGPGDNAGSDVSDPEVPPMTAPEPRPGGLDGNARGLVVLVVALVIGFALLATAGNGGGGGSDEKADGGSPNTTAPLDGTTTTVPAETTTTST